MSPSSGGRRRDVLASEREAEQAAKGELLLRMAQEVEVPAGSEEWLSGLVWLLDALEDAPCATAAWLIDTHLHARDPHGWHLAFAPRVDHVLLAQRDDLPRFHAAGLTGASWLPLACAPDDHAQPTPARGRDLDVVFVGHLLPIHARRRHLLELLRSRFHVHVAEGKLKLPPT